MSTPESVRIVGASVQTELPVIIAELGPIADRLQLAREAIDELRISHPQSPESNVKSVYMSPWKSHMLNAKLLPLCASVVEIAKAAAPKAWSGELDSLGLDLLVTHCWGAIYEQADYTAPHNHWPADLSCVVYLEAEAGCAPLVFSKTSAYQPRPGTLIMFPGITMHEVPATPGRRVVVAMNLFKQLGLGPQAPAAG
ncbi:hypothetical protein [Pelomonas sp. Root1237]|uniref:hypothetical protein n=1 Tax=Pelomonas sp. Root1237 TaxID=1736434 RepID=UPI000700B11E|nr:hypothetical protein [Pelomonas sp. Root1237]KQV96490.1 hypothetical protein ASC91_02770 [Pelomonas sp. Root1237]